MVQRVAWCTGGGQLLSIAPRVLAWDALSINGEVSEQTIHSAREQGLQFSMPQVTMPLNVVVFAH
ncbi:hypothetical protein ACNKHT_03985 [Shigella flexneri]